jgi:hypothetical protein
MLPRALAAGRQVLEIQALFHRGERARARAMAEALLARDPAAPEARRLRSLLEQNP